MTGIKRYFFEVAYDGTAYSGWQVQPGQPTVQGAIEDAFRKFIPDFSGVTASGRTDTGVHCEQQFFHADIPSVFSQNELHHKLNRMLPRDISIGSVRLVGPEAHARFDAMSRSYEYRISRKKDAFRPRLVYWFERGLDLSRMNEACDILLKHENFESLSRVRTEVNHFICNITHAGWVEENDQLTFRVSSNRFLRGMVRAIVGSLLEVGEGKRTVMGFEQMLLAKDRREAGPAAPPEGLFLVQVTYPAEIFLD